MKTTCTLILAGLLSLTAGAAASAQTSEVVFMGRFGGSDRTAPGGGTYGRSEGEDFEAPFLRALLRYRNIAEQTQGLNQRWRVEAAERLNRLKSLLPRESSPSAEREEPMAEPPGGALTEPPGPTAEEEGRAPAAEEMLDTGPELEDIPSSELDPVVREELGRIFGALPNVLSVIPWPGDRKGLVVEPETGGAESVAIDRGSDEQDVPNAPGEEGPPGTGNEEVHALRLLAAEMEETANRLRVKAREYRRLAGKLEQEGRR